MFLLKTVNNIYTLLILGYRLILPSFLSQVFIVLVLMLFSLPAYAENDYAIYAKEQASKQQKTIAPYQAEVDALIKNILAKQAQPDIRQFKQELQSVAKTQYSRVYKSPDFKQAIIIFVSFSMPNASIKGWMNQAQKIGAAVCIRGLVNNSFKDTAKVISALVQDQSGGLLIEPNLFKQYSITQVPAVVVASGDDFSVIYGDVLLDCALEKISHSMQYFEQNDLLEVIKKLRGGKSV